MSVPVTDSLAVRLEDAEELAVPVRLRELVCVAVRDGVRVELREMADEGEDKPDDE